MTLFSIGKQSMLPILRKNIKLCGAQDMLFSEQPYPKKFEFNQEVANVFDDMISRSVPLYQEVTQSIVEWTYLFYQKGSVIYDIGCSTGTTICALTDTLPFPIRAIGVDTSQAMLDKALLKLSSHPSNDKHSITFLCEDVCQLEFEPSSVAIINYTLQFISVAKRLPLLKKLYQSLNDGGLLIISEKLRSSCPEFQESTTRIYESFKERAGYSKTEIERKKEALDDVLIPLTLEEEVELIRNAGFSKVEPMIKWNNFCTFVAIKS